MKVLWFDLVKLMKVVVKPCAESWAWSLELFVKILPLIESGCFIEHRRVVLIVLFPNLCRGYLSYCYG